MSTITKREHVAYYVTVSKLYEETREDGYSYRNEREVIYTQEMPLSFSVSDLARHLNDQDREWALARYQKELQKELDARINKGRK